MSPKARIAAIDFIETGTKRDEVALNRMDEHCHFSTKKVRADYVLGLGGSAGKGDRMDGDIII